MSKDKKYIAIGHFKGNENITSVALSDISMKNFRSNCASNAFVPWVIISEEKMKILKSLENPYDIFKEVMKLTSNYRRWNDICEYIEQCFDIMEEKMERA